MQLGRRTLSAVLAGAVVLGGVSLASYQLFAPTPVRAADKDEKERHPRMAAALKELREARKELKDADHDFGGQRKEALEAVDKAIEHIDKALEWGKKHDK